MDTSNPQSTRTPVRHWTITSIPSSGKVPRGLSYGTRHPPLPNHPGRKRHLPGFFAVPRSDRSQERVFRLKKGPATGWVEVLYHAIVQRRETVNTDAIKRTPGTAAAGSRAASGTPVVEREANGETPSPVGMLPAKAWSFPTAVDARLRESNLGAKLIQVFCTYRGSASLDAETALTAPSSAYRSPITALLLARFSPRMPVIRSRHHGIGRRNLPPVLILDEKHSFETPRNNTGCPTSPTVISLHMPERLLHDSPRPSACTLTPPAPFSPGVAPFRNVRACAGGACGSEVIQTSGEEGKGVPMYRPAAAAAGGGNNLARGT